MKDKVLITGGNGFVGTRLTRLLCGMFKLKVFVRQFKSKVCVDEGHVVVDISGRTQWKEHLNDVNTIVHLAGVAHNKSNVNDYIKNVNVRGTINLAKQAKMMGVKRFIYISSISVYGDQSCKPFKESSKVLPQSFSAQCKLEAEKGLLKIAKNSHLEVVIIRPALVYGAGSPGNIGKLVRLVQKTPLLPFGLCENKRSFISVDNLVDFISRTIDHPKAKNQIFCISDDHDISIREFTGNIAAGLNKKLVQIPIPVTLMQLIARLLGRTNITKQLLGSLQLDSTKAQELLGWIPPYTMEQVMASLSENKK